MMKVFLILSVLFSSAVALGESGAAEITLQPTVVSEQPYAAPAEAGPVLQEKALPVEMINRVVPDVTSADFYGKLMSILVALYMGMWTLGEILTRVSVWTDNKWDNKLAERVSQITWFIGAFAGRMGWKLPKLVIEAEAEKIAAKKASASPTDKTTI